MGRSRPGCGAGAAWLFHPVPGYEILWDITRFPELRPLLTRGCDGHRPGSGGIGSGPVRGPRRAGAARASRAGDPRRYEPGQRAVQRPAVPNQRSELVAPVMVALRDVLPDRLDGRRLWSREVWYPEAGGWLVRVLGGSPAGAEG